MATTASKRTRAHKYARDMQTAIAQRERYALTVSKHVPNSDKCAARQRQTRPRPQPRTNNKCNSAKHEQKAHLRAFVHNNKQRFYACKRKTRQLRVQMTRKTGPNTRTHGTTTWYTGQCTSDMWRTTHVHTTNTTRDSAKHDHDHNHARAITIATALERVQTRVRTVLLTSKCTSTHKCARA